jgi:hypothetical protein
MWGTVGGNSRGQKGSARREAGENPSVEGRQWWLLPLWDLYELGAQVTGIYWMLTVYSQVVYFF